MELRTLLTETLDDANEAADDLAETLADRFEATRARIRSALGAPTDPEDEG